MPLAVVQPVNTELLCIFGLKGPQQFDVACSAVVLLGLLVLQDVINLQVKPLRSFGLVLALVGHEFLLDRFPDLMLSRLPDLCTLIRWTGNPFLLSQVLYSGNGQVGDVRPLEIVIDDPDFLWGIDCEALG